MAIVNTQNTCCRTYWPGMPICKKSQTRFLAETGFVAYKAVDGLLCMLCWPLRRLLPRTAKDMVAVPWTASPPISYTLGSMRWGWI